MTTTATRALAPCSEAGGAVVLWRRKRNEKAGCHSMMYMWMPHDFVGRNDVVKAGFPPIRSLGNTAFGTEPTDFQVCAAQNTIPLESDNLDPRGVFRSSKYYFQQPFGALAARRIGAGGSNDSLFPAVGRRLEKVPRGPNRWSFPKSLCVNPLTTTS